MRKSKKNENFMDKEKIILFYNQGIEKYNEYCRNDSENESDRVLLLIGEAGTFLYQAFEAGLKRYLIMLKQQDYKDKKIQYGALTREIIEIESMNRPQLITIFKTLQPHLRSTLIDFDVINANAKITTNAHKHSLSVASIKGYRAVLPEIKKFILEYVDHNAKLAMESITGEKASTATNDLFEKTNFFNAEGHWNYVLITDELSDLTDTQRKAITHIKWSLVLDFDPSSDTTGLANAFSKEHKLQPNRFNVSNPDRTDFNKNSPTPYWFYLNGVTDMPNTMVDDNNLRQWAQKYLSILPMTFARYHAEFEKSVRVIILSDSIEKVKDIIRVMDAIYEDRVEFFILTSPASYSDLKYNITSIPLTASEFSNSIIAYGNLFKITPTDYSCMMPTKNGILVEVNQGQFSHFELVHKNAGESLGASEESKSDKFFYQGRGPLSWHGVKNEFGVARNEAATQINKMIHQMNESYGLFHLIHSPGLGGTTFSRMVAYEMRGTYPTCFLRQYSKDATVSQVFNLYNSLKNTIVIYIDANLFTQDQVNSFYMELKPFAFPFVIIYTRRKKPKENNDQNSIILKNMNDFECQEMKNRLEPYTTETSLNILNNICDNWNKINERSPFYMSLYTFEKDFVGIKPYIKKFLNSMTKLQKDIITYLSIADSYAHKAISESFFQLPLIPSESNKEEDTYFGKDSPYEDLLILETTSSSVNYKLRHPLFAEEIINQHLYEGPDGAVLPSEVRAENLISLLVDFIKGSKTNSLVNYVNTLDVLRNLFIMKERNDIIQDQFSPLVTKIKEMLPRTQDGENGIGRIFKTLVETYPDDPHFIAHLARFYTLVEKNYQKGILLSKQAINISESLDKKDPLLYHICGVNISRQIINEYKNSLIDSHVNKEEKNEMTWIQKIEDASQEALEMFKKTRILNNQEPGYISAIDLCVDIVDIGKAVSDQSDAVIFIQSSQGKWYMKYLDEALSLMEALRSVEEDSGLSRNKLQTKIDNLVGDLDKTVLMWESYLKQAKSEEVSQVRRFLARSKQAKLKKIGYEKASPKEIDAIMRLMEENMQDDPTNSANLRIWFEVIRYCTSQDPELLLDEALSKLTVWKETTGSSEANYYYFILVCIKAIEGASRAEAAIPALQIELKEKTRLHYSNREILEWLGEGKGIARLRASSIKHFNEENAVALKRLTGRISKYKNPGHAIIKSHNMEIFFNPKNAKQKFSAEDIGKRVSFAMGFSYDGLRAYDQSVIESDFSEDEENTSTPSILQEGVRVLCKVVKNVDYFTQVQLIDYYNEEGSIKFTDLRNGYSASKQPEVGETFYATIIEKRGTNSRAQRFWRLTMADIKQENLDNMPEWVQQLNNFKNS